MCYYKKRTAREGHGEDWERWQEMDSSFADMTEESAYIGPGTTSHEDEGDDHTFANPYRRGRLIRGSALGI